MFVREQDTKLISVILKSPQQSNFNNYENARWCSFWVGGGRGESALALLSLSVSQLFCSHPKTWLMLANNIKHIHLCNVLPTHCTTGWKSWSKLRQFRTNFHIRRPTDFSFPPFLSDHRSLPCFVLTLPHHGFFPSVIWWQKSRETRKKREKEKIGDN